MAPGTHLALMFVYIRFFFFNIYILTIGREEGSGAGYGCVSFTVMSAASVVFFIDSQQQQHFTFGVESY